MAWGNWFGNWFGTWLGGISETVKPLTDFAFLRVPRRTITAKGQASLHLVVTAHGKVTPPSVTAHGTIHLGWQMQAQATVTAPTTSARCTTRLRPRLSAFGSHPRKTTVTASRLTLSSRARAHYNHQPVLDRLFKDDDAMLLCVCAITPDKSRRVSRTRTATLP